MCHCLRLSTLWHWYNHPVAFPGIDVFFFIYFFLSIKIIELHRSGISDTNAKQCLLYDQQPIAQIDRLIAPFPFCGCWCMAILVGEVICVVNSKNKWNSSDPGTCSPKFWGASVIQSHGQDQCIYPSPRAMQKLLKPTVNRVWELQLFLISHRDSAK